MAAVDDLATAILTRALEAHGIEGPQPGESYKDWRNRIGVDDIMRRDLDQAADAAGVFDLSRMNGALQSVRTYYDERDRKITRTTRMLNGG